MYSYNAMFIIITRDTKRPYFGGVNETKTGNRERGLITRSDIFMLRCRHGGGHKNM